MPFYTPRFEVSDFEGGKHILASEHLQYLEAGATLDGTKFPAGAYGPGKLIARNTTSGKFEPFTTATGFDEFAVLEYGFYSDGKTDLIAGSVIVRGSVYEKKLADVPTDEFKKLVPMIRFVKHIKTV